MTRYLSAQELQDMTRREVFAAFDLEHLLDNEDRDVTDPQIFAVLEDEIT